MATILDNDESYVLLRRHFANQHRIRVIARHRDSLVLLRTHHRISYSRGREEIVGTESIDMRGRRTVQTAMMYSAFCACGQWTYQGSPPDARRYAVTEHLRAAETDELYFGHATR